MSPVSSALQADSLPTEPLSVGAFQSAEWALVKWLTGTDLVVDQALNDHQSRK